MSLQPTSVRSANRHLSDADFDAYPWILAWGLLCRFPQETTNAQVRKAIAEKAPPTAISRIHDDDRWVTLEDIIEHETRLWMLDYAYARDMVLPYRTLRVWLDPLSTRAHAPLERSPLS
jgi:hypothetical protein